MSASSSATATGAKLEADLVAEKLINEFGYQRRDKELADAKRTVL